MAQPDMMGRYTELYRNTLKRIERNAQRQRLFLVSVVALSATAFLATLYTKSPVVSGTIIIVASGGSYYLVRKLLLMRVTGYTKSDHETDDGTSLHGLTADCYHRISYKPSKGRPSVVLINGELRPELYLPLFKRLPGKSPGVPAAVFAFGPAIYREGDFTLMDIESNVDVTRAIQHSNPALWNAVVDGRVNLLHQRARAPFHIGVINDRDVYIEELHQPYSPRGAYLIHHCDDLAKRWLKYMDDLELLAHTGVAPNHHHVSSLGIDDGTIYRGRTQYAVIAIAALVLLVAIWNPTKVLSPWAGVVAAVTLLIEGFLLWTPKR